eukprot:2266159-Rhodomonas_salina.1
MLIEFSPGWTSLWRWQNADNEERDGRTMGWPFLERVIFQQLEAAEEQARHRLAGDMYLEDAMRTIRGEVGGLDVHWSIRPGCKDRSGHSRSGFVADGTGSDKLLLPKDVLEHRRGSLHSVCREWMSVPGVDGSGAIDASELKDALWLLKVYLSEDDVDKIVRAPSTSIGLPGQV